MVKPNETTKRILKHFAFWVFILALQVTRSGLKTIDTRWADLRPLLVEHSLMLPLLAGTSYFFASYLIPFLYSTRRYAMLSFLSVTGAAAAILIMRLVLYYYVFPVYYPSYSRAYPGFWNFNLTQYTFYIFSTVAIVVMLKYSGQIRRMEKERAQLEKQNLTSELALLRNQVNPHFLFNTLNNIHALTGRDPELSQQSICELSDIMRYMTREATADKVPLVSEIEYLSNYIGLQSLRFDKKDYIRFTVTGDPGERHLPPMLLVPLAENAFKHGSREATPPGIMLSLDIGNDSVRFSVKNHIRQADAGNPPTVGGIGITNLKRRLELLFPDKHRLDIQTDGMYYLCELFLSFS